MRGTNVWSADRLREALEKGTPLTVLDIRTAEQRAEWWIPGSVHAPVGRTVADGNPLPLTAAVKDLPKSCPLVVVCALGKTGMFALEPLRKLGFEAISLQGGMQAWSEAWNTAEVALPAGSPTVTQIRRTGKGCLSYLAGSSGEAAVIDPSLSAAVYESLAKARGLRITAILETHVHADHVSRARTLSKATGATLYIPEQQRVKYPFHALRDGDEIRLGATTLKTLLTPGHTYESACYMIGDVAVATGDTLFVRGVGRPDLKAAANAESEDRARLLYQSLTRKLFALADSTIVLPCHTSEPIAFDGVPHAAPMGAARKAAGVDAMSEAAFARHVLSNLPPTPPNHLAIVHINEGLEPTPPDLAILEAGANRCAVGQAK